ncbi:MAG: PAS domain-containing protein [Gemmatimonadales bacterium]
MLDSARSLDTLDRIGEAIFGLDHDGRFTYLNSSAQRLLPGLTGASGSDLLGTIIWNASPSFSETPLGRALRRAEADGVPVVHPVRDPVSGALIELRVYPTPDGMSVLLLAPSSPGTARVLDHMSDLYLACDEDWRLTLLNERAGEYLRFLGHSRDELLGQSVWDVIPGLSGSRFQAEAFRAVVEQTEVEFESLFAPMNRWFSVRVTPTPEGIVACARELSGRRVRPRVDGQRAQDDNQRFKSLVESIDDVVFQLDVDQRCVNVFGRWLEREGFLAEQFVGRTTRDIVGPAAAPIHERANRRALAGETVTYEWVLSTTRGPRHVLNTLSPLRDPSGAITGIVGVGRDITARIETERQVLQAQKMEAVGRFAGGVAHDLNNMMMIIMGFSDFLLATLERQDPRWCDADEIRKAAERAMQLTRQLLGFSRHRIVARQVLSLNDVVSGMERMLRPLLGEDMVLITDLSSDIGGIEADYGQMEQVVMNLTLNARDAMASGGRLSIQTLNVDFPDGLACQHPGTAIPGGSYVMLTVSDTGHGMSEEIKSHLFEPFFTTKPTTQNTGLGLATVYGIVAQSAGYIWVESETGEGASFKICFPRVLSEDSAGAADEVAAPAVRGTETILLVEDEAAVRMVASRVLAEQGYLVLEAANGREALIIAEQVGKGIDLVLTDMIMPEMGGQELTAHITRVLPAARFMYMSGYSEADKLQRGIRESGEPFLQKPFSSENLVASVRHALDRVRR